MLLSKFFKWFGFICIILAGLLFWRRNIPQRVMFLAAPVKREIKPKIKKNLPVRLIIKNLNIDLPIFSAKVIGQNWQTTSLGVSWLDISPHPGEIGNSIMYGHNWPNLLGNLIYAKPGQEIEIKYSDGK